MFKCPVPWSPFILIECSGVVREPIDCTDVFDYLGVFWKARIHMGGNIIDHPIMGANIFEIPIFLYI